MIYIAHNHSHEGACALDKNEKWTADEGRKKKQTCRQVIKDKYRRRLNTITYSLIAF